MAVQTTSQVLTVWTEHDAVEILVVSMPVTRHPETVEIDVEQDWVVTAGFEDTGAAMQETKV